MLDFITESLVGFYLSDFLCLLWNSLFEWTNLFAPLDEYPAQPEYRNKTPENILSDTPIEGKPEK